MPRIVRLDIDPDVIALAAKAHAAFPDVPVQGVDIVREAGTGKLFVIEINAGWNTWHFSSPFGKKLQAEFGLDYHGQFGGFSVAADALVEAAATGAA
jgi:D-alanine-D-alanine ligase-like ATP-grasp enzyme